MYVLHVGVNHILRGTKPNEIVDKLRLRCDQDAEELVATNRGKAIHATTMMTNAKVKRLCKDIRANYL